MNLIISLTNPDILPDSLRTRRVEFGASGGLIGRHQDCDWVLDDPERFVSSRHLRILLKGEVFYAEDISTNGTYLNEELIGKGNKIGLVTGDVLRLGRFILSVEQRDESGLTIGDLGSAGPAADLLSDAYLGEEDALFAEAVKGDDLLAAPGATDEIEDFIGDDFSASSSTDDNLLSDIAPLAGVQDVLPVQRQAETSEAVPSDWMTRGAKSKKESTPPSPAPTPKTPKVSDELLGEHSQPIATADDYGLTPVPPEAKPELKPEPAKVKPKAKKKPAAKPAPKKVAAKKTPKRAAKKTPKVAKAPKVTKSKPKKAAAKTAEPAKKVKAKSIAPAGVVTAAVVPAAAAVAAALPAPKPKPAPVSAPQYSEPISEDFGEALAGSLLLKPDQATGETGHLLGLVMRELVEGSLDLMESRNQMCHELRLSGPKVGARENNPLKVSINYQDALNRMLQGEEMGFKPPVESATEVVADLKLHQLGVLAGIDAGVKALLDALDPKIIGDRKGGIAGFASTSKMSEQHAKIREDTVERSDGVFWRAFKQAYKSAVSNTYGRS